MAPENSILPQLDGHGLAIGPLDQAVELWGSPLGYSARRQTNKTPPGQGANAACGFISRDRKYLVLSAATSWQPHRMLVAGAVILGSFVIAALAYIGSSAHQTSAAQTERSAAVPQPARASTDALAATAAMTPAPSPDATVAISASDLPSFDPVGSARAASPPPVGRPPPPQTVSASQNEDTVFVQRPGVNLRSGPSANARVLATTRKGTRLTVKSREGDWVQVEGERFTGWIRSRFLAANEPP